MLFTSQAQLGKAHGCIYLSLICMKALYGLAVALAPMVDQDQDQDQVLGGVHRSRTLELGLGLLASLGVNLGQMTLLSLGRPL